MANNNNWSKPQAMAIPKEGYFTMERGRYGPIFPRTPANYGFTIIAKIKPGREDEIRQYGKTIEDALKGDPTVLAPLQLHAPGRNRRLSLHVLLRDLSRGVRCDVWQLRSSLVIQPSRPRSNSYVQETDDRSDTADDARHEAALRAPRAQALRRSLAAHAGEGNERPALRRRDGEQQQDRLSGSSPLA